MSSQTAANKQKRDDLLAPDHLPTCPLCGDLCEHDAYVCPRCGRDLMLTVRPLVGHCSKCERASGRTQWNRAEIVVSGSGYEHLADYSNGHTLCGHDATGDQWTWNE